MTIAGVSGSQSIITAITVAKIFQTFISANQLESTGIDWNRLMKTHHKMHQSILQISAFNPSVQSVIKFHQSALDNSTGPIDDYFFSSPSSPSSYWSKLTRRHHYRFVIHSIRWEEGRGKSINLECVCQCVSVCVCVCVCVLCKKRVRKMNVNRFLLK